MTKPALSRKSAAVVPLLKPSPSVEPAIVRQEIVGAAGITDAGHVFIKGGTGRRGKHSIARCRQISRQTPLDGFIILQQSSLRRIRRVIVDEQIIHRVIIIHPSGHKGRAQRIGAVGGGLRFIHKDMRRRAAAQALCAVYPLGGSGAGIVVPVIAIGAVRILDRGGSPVKADAEISIGRGREQVLVAAPSIALVLMTV